MKVLILGDSIAKGVVYDDAQGRYVLLHDCCTNLFADTHQVSIENDAMMGSTVRKGLKQIERIKDELPNYDYTVIEYGGNDCDFDWKAVSENPAGEHFCKTPIDDFAVLYEDLVKKVTEYGSTPVLMTLPPIDAEKYFAWISRGLNAGNILKFLGDVERIARWQQRFNFAVMDTARKLKTKILDITSPFYQTVNYKTCFCTDGIHPNEQGHELIYRAISAQT